MARSIDRRSVNNAKQAQSDTDLTDLEPSREVDMRQDGSVRRYGGGGRAMADYFSADNRMKTVARGELLGILQMLEWNRDRSRGLVFRLLDSLVVLCRRAWAWAWREPYIPSIARAFAAHYEANTIQPVTKAVAKKQGVEHGGM